MYGELPEIKTTTADGMASEGVRGFPVEIPEPRKMALLRLPTNEELMQYLAAQRSIYRNLSARQGEGEDVPSPDADRRLFHAIRLDSGEPFDDAEMLKAIGMITRHRVIGCERDGSTYKIILATPFGRTVHTVKIPTEKDQQIYRRDVLKVRDLPHGVEERRFPPGAPVALYDKVLVDVAGYLAVSGNGHGSAPTGQSVAGQGGNAGGNAGNVPPHHKRAVVTELMSALMSLDPVLEDESGESGSPNF